MNLYPTAACGNPRRGLRPQGIGTKWARNSSAPRLRESDGRKFLEHVQERFRRVGERQLTTFRALAVLKRYLPIFNEAIFDSNVDRLIPTFAAAPDGPNTRPPLSRKANSIISFSWAPSLWDSFNRLSGSLARGRRESQLSSTEKFSD